MLYLKHYKQKLSDKFGVMLMKQAQKIDIVKERKQIDFKPLYTSELSKAYKFPKGVTSEIIEVGGICVETLFNEGENPTFALIQLHGGAYVFDYNDTYRKSGYEYLKCKDNMKVFSPIYSLAPEKPYPHALHEVVAVYQYVLKQGFKANHIMIVGDSAGGGLAIAVTLYLRDHHIPLPKALITMSAWTNLAMDGESHIKNYPIDPMFGEGSKPLDVLAYTQDYDVRTPYISPKYGDFSKFTDMCMFVGGDEIIESDTLDVAELVKVNHEVYVHDFDGMFHVFPFGFHVMASSRKAWKIIKKYIHKKFGDDV